MILFFFSSRRRHTRSKRDWSSDVCSSDLLEAARKAGVERVIYGSTTWVYSDCAEGEVDEETVIAAPSHLYTATKLAGETYCRAYSELYGIEYTILRFGIPYGPRARDGAVVPIFI